MAVAATGQTLPDQIRISSRLTESASLRTQVQQHLDTSFADVDFILGHAGPSDRSGTGTRRGKRRRNLQEEIGHWEREEAAAEKELAKTSSILSTLLAETQTKLQTFLSSAQELSVERYTVVKKLTGLISELDEMDAGDEDTRGGRTLLRQMEEMQGELARLEAGLAWASVMEQVLRLSEQTLSPASHRPSPLAALPHYRDLHSLVESLAEQLPSSMALLGVITEIRKETWRSLREVLAKNLLDACEAIKWPTRMQYESLPTDLRRNFERAYSDLLYLQTESENLHGPPAAISIWSAGEALYPLQAMVEPISLRFKYNFQGSKTTNRVDKPEWAFANILDQIYEHTPFLSTILQPLTAQSGYPELDVRSEFILALFPTVLNLLRSRIPRLLDRPALLANSVYQTVLFDDAIREGGFDLRQTSAGAAGSGEWEGLTGVILKEEGWFEQWLAGEKKFVDAQLHDIISHQDAWTISDETVDEDEREADGRRPTISARQIKALVEQVTDRYSPLPALINRYPFLLQIQLPTLQTYHQRINSSLDAFENISSAFARHIPGALAGNTRSGVNFDQTKLTSGEAGLVSLIKANISAAWVLQGLRGWADETFFVELSADLKDSAELRWRIQDPLLPSGIRSAGHDHGEEGLSVFDVMIWKYEALCERSEDMMVKLVTIEVEQELREHLKRRWDQSPHAPSHPSSHLLSALATYTTHLRSVVTDLPPILVSRIYRRTVSHLVNHITHRAIYSGWSKFSLTGAKELKDEITDFMVSSSDILSASPSSLIGRGSDIPWRPIMDKITILSLPKELSEAETQDGKVTYSQGMAAAWSDGPETLRAFLDRSGVRGMDRGGLQALLRRREECWR